MDVGCLTIIISIAWLRDECTRLLYYNNNDGVCGFSMCLSRRDNSCVCAPHNVAPANPRMHIFTISFIHSIVKLVVKSTTRFFPFNNTIFTPQPQFYCLPKPITMSSKVLLENTSKTTQYSDSNNYLNIKKIFY